MNLKFRLAIFRVSIVFVRSGGSKAVINKSFVRFLDVEPVAVVGYENVGFLEKVVEFLDQL